MLKSELLAALQQEIRRHDFAMFVDKLPSVAQGGNGIIVPGCPACKKRLNTHSQYLDHLADDVMPPLLDRLSSESSGAAARMAHRSDQKIPTNGVTTKRKE